MAKLNFGSPGMAAVGGLSQGLSQGFTAGSELAMQKQAAKQKQQHDAMNLLMQGMKNMPDDPAQGEAYMKFFGNVFQQATGQPLPDIPWAKAKPFSDQYKAIEADVNNIPNLSSDDKKNLVLQRLGLKPGKQEQQLVPWKSPSGQTYMVKPGEAGRMDIQMILGNERVGLGQSGLDLRQRGLDQAESHFQQKQQFGEGGKQTYAPPGSTKRVSELENLIRTETDPEKRQTYINEYEQDYKGKVNLTPGKETPGRVWGTNKEPDKIGFKRPNLQLRGTGGTLPGAKSGGIDPNAIKAKAQELIKQGKDPAKVKAWAASKGVALE